MSSKMPDTLSLSGFVQDTVAFFYIGVPCQKYLDLSLSNLLSHLPLPMYLPSHS